MSKPQTSLKTIKELLQYSNKLRAENKALKVVEKKYKTLKAKNLLLFEKFSSLEEIRDELLSVLKVAAETEIAEKFDECRGCLARIAHKLNIELPNEAPEGITEWHEHLILELDKWKGENNA